MRHFVFISAVFALLAVSCVYPFTPDIRKEGGGFVIDGDLNVGGSTIIKLSYVQPFDFDEKKDEKIIPSASVLVECGNGCSYTGYLISAEDGIATFEVDLSGASLSDRYRLSVHNIDNNKDYVSSWLTPVMIPQIERFWYEANPGSVNFYVTFHGNDGHDKYRLYVNEVWRHHAYFSASLTYDRPTNTMISISPNTYYCYSHNEQKSIELISTEGYDENRVDSRTVLTVSRTSIKLQDIYKVTLNIQAIDDASYQFWSTLRDNSETTGSLYQTVPNQVIGNIRCAQDTTEVVYGYINASSVATRKLILRSTEVNLWDSSSYKYEQPVSFTHAQWPSRYDIGYRPVYVENGIYLWTKKECVDCREHGGTNVKPLWWNDYE